MNFEIGDAVILVSDLSIVRLPEGSMGVVRHIETETSNSIGVEWDVDGFHGHNFSNGCTVNNKGYYVDADRLQHLNSERKIVPYKEVVL